MRKNVVLTSLVLISLCTTAAAFQDSPVKSAEQVLKGFVTDFRQDPVAAEEQIFGIRVTGAGGGDWHVNVSGRKDSSGEWEVDLRTGLPEIPAPYFILDTETLHKIDRGELSALTAMARAQWSDPTPMDVRFMAGFKPGPGFLAAGARFSFHFWTRGFPEIIRFGKSYSRVSHGANASILYYQKGFRSAWMSLDPGQHANKDPKDQTNPFPSLFIVVRGTAQAKIGGKHVTASAGEAILVAPEVTHELWNPYAEPVEFILVMFGDGA